MTERGGAAQRAPRGIGNAGDQWARPAYTRVSRLQGPLLVVPDAEEVGWDEFADIRLDSGEARHGLVLDTARDRVLVQVLEGTGGMRFEGTRVAFSGTPLRVPVGTSWLGRVCDGLGNPLDGGPPVLGVADAPAAGVPLNPVHREPPADPVLTGVSAIDALTTLARGQKLPIFSRAGLPHLDLAAQIAAQASAGNEPFCVVFAAMGLTHADAAAVRDTLEDRSAAGDLVLLLNLADAPVIERILTPRIALTVAEHLAFEEGRHVLVVMGDMTAYCEALREVSAARGEIPARRAYPGYLYSDLASLYERCGRIRGRPGSVTLVPVLTMPGGDITHPVPDLTGYITEGQIVLSEDLHAAGVYPPVDALESLSRLMRKAAGAARTRADHPDVAAQVLAALSRARRARELGELVGPASLSETDRRHLDFERVYREVLVSQGAAECRPLEETLDRAWRALAVLPRRELTMLPDALIDAHLAEDR
ncbi:V-type ATP synthase subunit B [Actinomadura bangladeshensis]|uniref:V-type ATP synthase beta chain n=1 Tax=Actinomadura bangladeshensis TaxID=453573 RepID=A0A4R4P7L6_9ACTN|nr:V-type ATP synthase subunit B [Actinomadura bangladeshensis]TDC16162.1 V-type ATP synthase subunit B [Actinomadura bangladeshensis]